ncbi:BLUF domain-containing protein [Thalassoroseus pseudoceratinae]|uniref:BLUF domain-containing protein n=1 Tax=Thalassoroseus pseudoceratinae TaxID=2713176 RepID=UPI001420E82B|nr:BLUF domain-containing protein [Thalassoroseus pseudoceratinae]
MAVSSLVYASRATRDFTSEDLNGLAARASRKNKGLRVTGYLCHQKGIFFQYIEGPTAELSALIKSIRNDDRHDIFNEIDLGRIDDRKFPDWNMRSIDSTSLQMIQMEDILRQVLENMAERNYGLERLRNLVLPMVAKISERQAMLSGQAG